MNLQYLTDKTLHQDTLKLVRQERRSSVEVLLHLKENDRRKLYSDFKCSSLFDYCVRLLGYSEASAQRRIVAARMLENFPDLGHKIEEGTLTLTNLSLANQYFREHKITDSKRKKEVLMDLENLTKTECEKRLFHIFGTERPFREERKRISQDKTLLSFVLTDETLDELDKLWSLFGKKQSMEELMKFMVRAAVEKVEKKKFKVTEKVKALSPAKVIGRTPLSALKREVYLRDKKCVRCGGVHQLNYDHRLPWALGGKTNSENIRLLCFNCNQRARILTLGPGPP